MTTVHRSLSRDSTWVLVHIDERAMVYVKETSVDAAWLAQHAFREYHPLTLANRRLTRETLDRIVLDLERAVEAQPRYAQLWMDLGLALRTRGDNAGAVRAFEKAVEIEPENPLAWNRIATVAIDAGDTDAALRACRRLTEISPENPASWHQLGRACEASGDRGEAAKAFAAALELDPDYADAWESTFRMHLKAQAWDDALLFTDRWIEARPDDYLGYYYKAEILMRLERGSQAIRAAEAASRLNPRAPGAHMLLARLYTEARDYARALKHIDTVLMLAPGDVKALEVREYLLEQLRQ
jgi:tetratricopeptide (TPR) repeat protein